MPNEWNFTGNAAHWITDICRSRPELGFDRAEVEQPVPGGLLRHDLAIFDSSGKICLTGEVKRPDTTEGSSPAREGVRGDAFRKAESRGQQFCFTWNVNHAVLWDRHKKLPPQQCQLALFDALPYSIKRAEELNHPAVERDLKKFLVNFLETCSKAIFKEKSNLPELPFLPVDRKFVFVWEAALRHPVALTLEELVSRYEDDKSFSTQLDFWMKNEIGASLSDAPDALRLNLENAAKFSTYVVANKILFYKALRRNPAFQELRPFYIPSDVSTGAEFSRLLERFWGHAREITGDYETIFQSGWGDSLPTLSDNATAAWRDLSEQSDGYDFTKLGHDVIGQIFERLLAPEERQKYGQHFTRSEIVDLINAFCIRRDDARVLDPACGGGTFLVRAYARKKMLGAGTLPHSALLNQIYGVDISAYPAHLSAVNLATRDLVDGANYPLVMRGDFFDLRANKPAFWTPLGTQKGDIVAHPVADLDAVVGNPPYIRHEKLGEYFHPKYKTDLETLIKTEVPGTNLSRRSDLHCYFFPHALSLLKSNGYLGFLVSSSWLDTEYGFRLQKFLLDNFRILAIIETAVEAWFEGARVTTSAVLLQRENDPAKRGAQHVPFVHINKPLSEILPSGGDERDIRIAFEAWRDGIENLSVDDCETHFLLPAPDGTLISVGQVHGDGFRARVLKQSDLEHLGRAPFVVEECDENAEPTKGGRIEGKVSEAIYMGSKWGLPLRAPDVFFDLLARGGGRWVPLGMITDVKFGVKSGCDAFFFPRDITQSALDGEPDEEKFRSAYGLSRAQTKEIRLIEAGDGTLHFVEAHWLEPEVHSVMELTSLVIEPENLSRKVFLCPDDKGLLRGTHALDYIRWGERQGFQKRSTLLSRASGSRRWYDLTGTERSSLVWSKAHQYRHLAWLNPNKLFVNCRMYDLFPINEMAGVERKVFCAILNSTLVAMSKIYAGRFVGREGNLDTEVLDVKMMLVPNPHGISKKLERKILKAFEALSNRKIGPLVEVDGSGDATSGELAKSDRQELDDATLELLGIADADERKQLRTALYREMTHLMRDIRRAERDMQKKRGETARHGVPTAHSLAAEIWGNLLERPYWKPLPEWIAADVPTQTMIVPQGHAKIGQASLFGGVSVTWGKIMVEVANEETAHWLKALSDNDLCGPQPVPLDDNVIRSALKRWESYLKGIETIFEAEARSRSAQQTMQQRIARELWRLLKAQKSDEPISPIH
ncbi:modification methylase PaeR7I [Abditibacteriota bacterium]|nr:modification methylase PaeR7I [Abditibacteriota bacterium]